MPSGHSATRVPAWQSQQQVSSPLLFENLRSPQGQLQSSGIDVTSDVPSLFLQVHVSVVPVWEQSEHVPSAVSSKRRPAPGKYRKNGRPPRH